MKFTTEAAVLKEALCKCINAIQGKGIMPILDCFLIEIEGGTMTVTGTDLEIGYRTRLKVETNDKMRFVVDGKLLTDLVKELKGKLAFKLIEVKDYGFTKMEVVSDNGKYNIAISGAQDYPEMIFEVKEKPFEINTDILHSGINFTEISVSKEDIRPAMAGLLMQLGGERLKLVSTDGHKLSFFTLKDFDEFTGDYILPKPVLSLLKRLPEGTMVNVYAAKNVMIFETGDDIITTRLIGDKHPNYEAVIPKESDKFAVLDRVKLLTTVRRLMLFETDGRLMRKVIFDFSDKISYVSLQCTNSGNSAVESIDCEYKGEPLKIAFNGNYLNIILPVFGSKNILLEMNKDSSAMVIKEDETAVNFCLVMPVKVNE